MTKKSLNIFTRTILILLICGVYLLWGTYFIYRWTSSGTVISVKNASSDIPGILVQNLIFAVMHIFSYAQWEMITVSHIVSFAASSLIGLVATGCFFQFIKDKSGTIWIPVLVHAVLDYSAVLGYN